jgi:hypothetical protein
MLRRTAVGLTAVALLSGLWGVVGWWNRPMPPPLGDITLEQVTPPDTLLSIRPERWCDESVPGFRASGTSGRPLEEVRAWYDDRFGPTLPEATARSNWPPGSTNVVSVYNDIQVSLREDASVTKVAVLTYATTSSDCLIESYDAWDSANASAYGDVCGRQLINFWGRDYERAGPQAPPVGWAAIDFAQGRTIAHDIEGPSVIYVKDGIDTDWYLYDIANRCSLD